MWTLYWACDGIGFKRVVSRREIMIEYWRSSLRCHQIEHYIIQTVPLPF